jgi:hypothetical protein
MPGMRNKRDVLYSCLCCYSATGYNRSKTAERLEVRRQTEADLDDSSDMVLCEKDPLPCTCIYGRCRSGPFRFD